MGIADRVQGTAPRLNETDLVIRFSTSDDKAAWNHFVRAAENGSFFHQFQWRDIFRDVFELTPHYLLAERQGNIVGVLPLVHQKSLLFGNALVSTPFCVLGGPLTTDPNAQHILVQTAVDLAKSLGCRSLEFRSRDHVRASWAVKDGLYALFARDLSSDHNANLTAIPRKQRAVLRKAMQGKLQSAVDPDIDAFFQVYSESMRNLGTPMFPRRYFEVLRAAFPDSCDVVVIRDEGVPVSAVLNFYYKDTVLPYYGGGTAQARNSGANDLLYWEVMRRAVDRGFRRFDFGRSKAGTGAFAFKKNWGFEPSWLNYEYWLPQGTKIPAKDPTNPVYATLGKVWKKLPVRLANFIGPFLIGGLG